jgi:hypothetical protein
MIGLHTTNDDNYAEDNVEVSQECMALTGQQILAALEFYCKKKA